MTIAPPRYMKFTLPITAAATLTTSSFAAPPHPEWTLYAPVSSTNTVLVDLEGESVHTWPSAFPPGLAVYLLDDGAILRATSDSSVTVFGGAGTGGRIERISWDGDVEWSYVAASSDITQHHDVEPLPNGNVLAVVWERFTAAEAIAMGRNPAQVGDWVWSDTILEIEPTGPTTGTIVWEWRAWDHLIQDFDPKLPNFGDPADNPGRIDINFGPTGSDWLHVNAVEYNAELDQIAISCHAFSELWIISHAPESDGDLIYRWGNPQAYGRGTEADRKLYNQHDPDWIPEGLPGEGNITMFNNGNSIGFSAAVELDTGVNPDGTYTLPKDGPYGPEDFAWECDSIDGGTFFTPFMGGTQRLANGNTLICIPSPGEMYELDEDCNAVWSHFPGTAFRTTRIDANDPRLEGLLWFACAGDLDGDGTVDAADLASLLGAWGPNPESAADLDGDGTVGAADLAQLLGAWGSC